MKAPAARRACIAGIGELDGATGVRFFSNLVDVAPDAVRVGLRVEVVWEDIRPGYAVPRFRVIHQKDTKTPRRSP